MNTAASYGAIRDWRALDLDDGGRSLIEASAGTGKTWVIGVLYLRLILERSLTPRQIVVTTFTNAAADELRQRLRARLRWAELRASATAYPEFDAEQIDEVWLHARWQSEPGCEARDLQRLRLAIAELDMAPVTTLHGLCQRILSDHPFAAGVPFEDGDLVGIDDLVGEIARDLLRRFNQSNEASDELIRLQRDADVAVKQDDLIARLKLLLMPGTVVRCLTDEEIRQLLPEAWAEKLRDLCGLFGARAAIRRHWQELANFIENPFTPIPDARGLEKGLRESLELTGVLKVHQDDPRLVEAAEFAVRCADNGVLRHKEQKFWRAVADWARTQARSRLASLNQHSFDELLSAVSDVLDKESKVAGVRTLADALFAAWPVALVDEFQDTDGVQYGILDRIYRNADGSQRGRLVMIGDPKQAIYSFRGGDLHAYQRAADQVDAGHRITLAVNRRSSRSLVDALNEFYGVAGDALGAGNGGGIVYACVDASDRQDHSPYTVDGKPCARPLMIHRQATCPDPDSAATRRDLALTVCANQIADLLNSGKHFIGEKPVGAEDIAVLLPANHQSNALRDLLRERGIPSVTTARDSVFATDVARELQVILYAVANSSEPGSMRAALATRLWGLDYATLRAMGDDSVRWQDIVKEFHAWHALWEQRGVLAVVDALIGKLAAAQLAATTGERALTDLRHLGELLQAQSDEITGQMELLEWLSDQRDARRGDEDATEARQLRIESDAKRVRLMTLHASKGLEFPIVFLPLMWDHAEKAGTGFHHVVGEDGTRCIELTEKAKETENFELQDERFRVLYVALTRAIHACHLFALPVDRPASGRSKHPASGTARSALDVMLARMNPPLDNDALKRATPRIRWIDGWHPTQATKFAAIETGSAPTREARTPLPNASMPLPARHSFTTLIRGLRASEFAPDASAGDENDADDGGLSMQIDEASPPPDASRATRTSEPHPDLLELEHVRGADFGNAVHAIFENRLPKVALAEQSELVHRQLEEFNVRCNDGRDQDWLANALVRRLQVVLDTPLGNGHGNSPRLADLDAADMRAEMEFHFSLDSASMHALRAACNAHDEIDLVPASHRILAGLMNGKIDLVFRHDGRFHVLDYKGNHLGDSIDDYRGDALAAEMDASDYRFQALLYTVALDRYLHQRIPGYDRSRHLGDCWYVFIRSVGLGDGAGVWRHRFGDELLDAVQKVFAGTAIAKVAA